MYVWLTLAILTACKISHWSLWCATSTSDPASSASLSPVLLAMVQALLQNKNSALHHLRDALDKTSADTRY